MKLSFYSFLVIWIFFHPGIAGSEPGKIGPGLARLVSSLPEDDPIAQRFQRMLREVQDSNPNERMVSAIDLGDREIARFISLPSPNDTYTPGVSPYRERPHLAIFQYNPERMRIIDFLEEEQHWEQIKRGLHLREWRDHPLVRMYPDNGTILVLEDLAKRTVLEKHSKEMSWELKEELRQDLKLVWDGTYGVSAAGPAPSSPPARSVSSSPCAGVIKKLP